MASGGSLRNQREGTIRTLEGRNLVSKNGTEKTRVWEGGRRQVSDLKIEACKLDSGNFAHPSISTVIRFQKAGKEVILNPIFVLFLLKLNVGFLFD